MKLAKREITRKCKKTSSCVSKRQIDFSMLFLRPIFHIHNFLIERVP